MRFLGSLGSVFLLLAATGCSDRVSYSYTSYGQSGQPMVEGTLFLPRLTADMGKITGSWKTKAIGKSEFDNGDDDINYQTGSGDLRGQVKNGVVDIEFHPADTEDMGFSLKGKITPEGFSGTWSFTCDAGDYSNRGRFVATAK